MSCLCSHTAGNETSVFCQTLLSFPIHLSDYYLIFLLITFTSVRLHIMLVLHGLHHSLISHR